MIGPHVSAAAGFLYPAAALQQTPATAGDSVVVASPLPGGVADVVRYLLNSVPPWVQAGGVVVGAIVAAFVLRYLFLRRRAIGAWLVSRGRSLQWALAAAALVLLVGAGSIGAVSWRYIQHDNGFCTGCHVMSPAFQRFSDPGNKHGKLSCHSCHQQSIFASMRQLYLWVAERPDKIGMHAKVANKVCETCHVTGDTARWQRIAATAGHRVHLTSDSSALKGLQCVKCHGVEVHRFRPVNATCGQTNCHSANQTNIVLAKMSGQTVRHCTSCHAFTADVPELATRDSAKKTLVPHKSECLGCHEMRKVLADFDEGRDPHRGTCGSCHDPHKQKTPAEAAASCATAGCHANWRDRPFHVGDNHRKIGPRCITCHVPHSAQLDASDCGGCHTRVRSRGALRPPVPFDTTRALRRSSASAATMEPTGSGPGSGHVGLWGRVHGPSAEAGDEAAPFEREEAPERDGGGVRRSRPPPPAADSFPHARHAKLACLECHETGAGHGRLTFQPPRGCAICHHQSPSPARCATCHHLEKYGTAREETLTVTVRGHQPHPRAVNFYHARHVTPTCLDCHTTPVTLLPPPEKTQCRDCHTDHHAAGRNCSGCHALADPRAEHKPVEAAHQRCDACHTATTIARLVPTRSFCSTCHAAKAKEHYDQQECTTCHFLAEPAVQRAKLVTPPPS